MISQNKCYGRKLLVAAATAGLAAIAAMPRSGLAIAAIGTYSEEWNAFFTPPTTGSWNNFEVVFTGNANIGAQSLNSGTDPFLNPNPITSSYDATSNTTTVEFSGSAGTYGNSSTWAQSSAAGFIGSGNSLHFGIQGNGGFDSLHQQSVQWTYTTSGTISSTETSVDLAANWAAPTSGTGNMVLFIEGTDPGVTTGQWFEIPYGGGTPSVTLTNSNAGTESFSNFGYFLSPTEIPLDQLNFGSSPPPGTSGSPFISLPTPGSLNPGASEVVATPEPGALALLAVAGAGMLLLKRRKKSGVPQ